MNNTPKQSATKRDVVGDRSRKPSPPAIAAENIPALLKTNPRWVGWCWKWNKRKWDKPPVDAKSLVFASSTDSTTWCDFETAWAAYVAGKVDGIGFVLGQADDGTVFSGVDQDDCRNVVTGALTPLATLIVDRLKSYTEISPTGTGVKTLCTGRKTQARSTSKELGLECYDSGRYFTITGQAIGSFSEVANCEAQLQWLGKTFLEAAGKSGHFQAKEGDNTLELARSALGGLNAVRADSYEDWILVGMILKSVSDDLLADWDNWSRQSHKYLEEECPRRWSTFHPARIGLGSLIHWAKQDGWRRPAGVEQSESDAVELQRIDEARELIESVVDEADSKSAAYEAIADPKKLDLLATYARCNPGGFAQQMNQLAEQDGVLQRDVKEIRDTVKKAVQRQQRERRKPAAINCGEHCPYRATSAGIVWDRPVRDDGVLAVGLTNFTARIVSQIVEDDGQETRRIFEVEGLLKRRSYRFEVAGSQFGVMNWVHDQLGAEAIVYPGSSLKDHARAAIQILSTDIASRTVYTHLGWRKIDGHWVFLHVGGAIGQTGSIVDITVSPGCSLAGYSLPAPTEGEPLRAAIRASLQLLSAGPQGITFPLLAATFRAVLGAADFSVGLFGPSGAGKTELAALALQHFGREMHARNLPANWSSTGNALEALAFAAKDVLLVVDDFAPTGSTSDVQRYHREADRLLRGQGNSAGRQRLRADATQRPTKYPRGLILCTGEDVPRGQSLRARQLALEVGPNDVNWQLISQCQSDAASGLYSHSLAGFIRWLAPRYESLSKELRERVIDLRHAAQNSSHHRRTPEIVANLLAAFELFIKFGQEAGAIESPEASELLANAFRFIGEAAASQAQFQESSEPTTRFLDLLAAALASGRAHVACPSGGEPESPSAWGWRQNILSKDGLVWDAEGKRVGWLEGDDLYLEPEASYAAAQQMAHDGGDALVVGSRTLFRRLDEKGLLASHDGGRLTVRRNLDGRRRAVLHLRAGALHREVCQTCQPCHTGREPEENGHDSWHGSGVPEPETCHEPCQNSRENDLVGTFGTNGTVSETLGASCEHHYVDTRTPEGRIRVACDMCGAFYGYRDDQQSTQGGVNGTQIEAF